MYFGEFNSQKILIHYIYLIQKFLHTLQSFEQHFIYQLMYLLLGICFYSVNLYLLKSQLHFIILSQIQKDLLLYLFTQLNNQHIVMISRVNIIATVKIKLSYYYHFVSNLNIPLFYLDLLISFLLILAIVNNFTLKSPILGQINIMKYYIMNFKQLD